MPGRSRGRPQEPPRTRLGAVVRKHRGEQGQIESAKAIGIPRPTLAGLELGKHYPSRTTARKLAAWLGWTVGQVFDAAETPASPDVVASDP